MISPLRLLTYLLQRHRRVPIFQVLFAFIVCSRFDYCRYVGFQVIPLCRFDLQFSSDEPWREPFYVMKFFFFMYEKQTLPLKLASEKPVLFQIVIQ